MPQIHLLDLCHVLLRQHKVINCKVFPDPILMYGFGNGHDLILQELPQNDLSRCLSVDLADLCQKRMGEDLILPFSKGGPGHGLDLVLGHQRAQFRLLAEGVNLHLIHHGAMRWVRMRSVSRSGRKLHTPIARISPSS